MRYLKLLPVAMLALMFAACEPPAEEEDVVDETLMEEPMDETGDAIDDGMDDMDDDSAWEEAGQQTEEAWEETQEAAGQAWEATKESADEAWDASKGVILGDMSEEEHEAFEECVDNMMEEMAATRDQAERGCWKKMRAEIEDEEDPDMTDEGEM